MGSREWWQNAVYRKRSSGSPWLVLRTTPPEFHWLWSGHFRGRLFAVRLDIDADLRDISVITHLFSPLRPDVVIGGEEISERNE